MKENNTVTIPLVPQNLDELRSQLQLLHTNKSKHKATVKHHKPALVNTQQHRVTQPSKVTPQSSVGVGGGAGKNSSGGVSGVSSSASFKPTSTSNQESTQKVKSKIIPKVNNEKIVQEQPSTYTTKPPPELSKSQSI